MRSLHVTVDEIAASTAAAKATLSALEARLIEQHVEAFGSKFAEVVRLAASKGETKTYVFVTNISDGGSLSHIINAVRDRIVAEYDFTGFEIDAHRAYNQIQVSWPDIYGGNP